MLGINDLTYIMSGRLPLIKIPETIDFAWW